MTSDSDNETSALKSSQCNTVLRISRPSRRRLCNVKTTKEHNRKKSKIKLCVIMGICSLLVLLILFGAAMTIVLVVGVNGSLDDLNGNNTTGNITVDYSYKPKNLYETTTTVTPSLQLNTWERPWLEQRLPKYITPNHYNISIDINSKDDEFKCETSIIVTVHNKTRIILLHSLKSIIKNVEVKTINLKQLSIVKQFVYPSNHYLVIIMRHTLLPGLYIIRTLVEGKINFGLTGVYKSYYNLPNGQRSKVIATLFAPVDARKQMPCFDEPHLKANFTLKLTYDSKYNAVSNMELRRRVKHNKRTTDQFKTTVKMSTYLLCYVISDYSYTETHTPKGVRIRVWAPSYVLRSTNYALEATNKTLQYYEDLFLIDYPLSKVDLVGLPNFAVAGMEHWGLITFRASRLLYDETSSSPEQRKRVAAIISHELAHQWFGNLVTMKWWNDVWLNEGSASYLEYLGTDNMERFHIYDLYLLENLYPVFRIDSSESARTLSNDVSSPNEINRMFDTTTYNKGACLLFMLQSFLGYDKMMAGLRGFLNSHAYGSANQTDLWRALSSASGVDIEHMMDSWTLQKGYPLVSVNQTNDNKLILQQQPYRNTIQERKGITTTWTIPLTFQISSSNQTLKYLLDGNTSAVIEFPNCSWFKANTQQNGYYRVNYQRENWIAIAKQLEDDHTVFSVRDRGNLLNDAFELAKSGDLDYQTFLNVTKYLVKETSYVPWRVALDAIYIIRSQVSSATNTLLKKYLFKLIHPLSATISLDVRDDLSDALVQVAVLSSACELDVPAATSSVYNLFSSWVVGNTSIPRQLRSLVYFHGIRNGNENDWNHLYEKYKNSTKVSERSEILLALGASQESSILERYLNKSLDRNKIALQDTAGALLAVARGSQTGRKITWQFIKSNWDELTDLFGHGVFLLNQVLERVLDEFRTLTDVQSIKQFMSEQKDNSNLQRILTRTLENISKNMEWRNSHDNMLQKWLMINT